MLNIHWDGKRLIGAVEELQKLSDMMVADGLEPLDMSKVVILPESDKTFAEMAAEMDAAEGGT